MSKWQNRHSIQERRDNRKGFIENVIKGMSVPVSLDVEITIIDAINYASSLPENEKLAVIMTRYDDSQLKKMWLDGSMAEFSALIHRAVLSLADQHIGEEL